MNYDIISKGDVMNAFEAGAEIETNYKDDIDRRHYINKYPSFNWEDCNYRIANKTADGINFHDFIDQVEPNCANTEHYADDRWHQTKCSRGELVRMLIFKPSMIKNQRLKPQQKKLVRFEWDDRDMLRDKWIEFDDGSEFKIVGFIYGDAK